jgi:formylglycine-generating enzyme required for sulfatase activity
MRSGGSRLLKCYWTGLLVGLGAVVAASAQQEELVVDLPVRATMAFVWIEPGTFTMGSPHSEAGRHDDEGPLHEVQISRGFWLGKYEVTQGQWQAVMGSAPWVGQPLAVEHPNHPAVNVSWNGLQEFIARLNRIEGEPVYRLPTEAEWEYACRAGTRIRWSFGDDEMALGDYAWFQGNARDVGQFYGHAVGMKLPNP